MKTMKKGKDIVRIQDNKYEQYLENGYVYTSKSEWKEKVRDVNKKILAEKAAEKEAEKKAKKDK